MPAIRMTLAAVALAAVTTATPTACKPHPSGNGSTPTTSTPAKATAKHQDDDLVEFEASCDQRNHAFNVKPNTRQARAAAEKMCQNTGKAIDGAPWPGGYSPVPLPQH